MTIFNLRPNQRVAVLIDGASLYSATKQLGFEVDFKTLKAKLEAACDLHSISYFTALHPSPEVHSPVRRLVDWLGHNGFRVVTKALREIVDPVTGRTRVKGSVIGEMSFEIAKAARRADHIVVISGDGDLAYAVEQAVASGDVRVSVVSSQEALSDELRRVADRVVDLAEVRSEISRRDLPVAEQRPMVQREERDNRPITVPNEVEVLPPRRSMSGFTVEHRSLGLHNRPRRPLLDLREAS